MGIREDVLKEILKDHKCYSTKKAEKGKIDLGYVIDQMYLAKEAIFYDEVFFPYMARFFKKVENWGIFPDAEWGDGELGYYLEIPCRYPCNTIIQDEIAWRIEQRMQPLWYGLEWSWAEPTLEECKNLIDVAEPDYPLVQQKMF